MGVQDMFWLIKGFIAAGVTRRVLSHHRQVAYLAHDAVESHVWWEGPSDVGAIVHLFLSPLFVVVQLVILVGVC